LSKINLALLRKDNYFKTLPVWKMDVRFVGNDVRLGIEEVKLVGVDVGLSGSILGMYVMVGYGVSYQG
jgi:hypothetical protein